MNNPTQIAQLAVLTIVERGLDFFLEEARRFVEETDLDKALHSSQLSHLQIIFQRNASDFAVQKREVKKFIDKQVDKDNKRGRQGWVKVGNFLYKRMFEFSSEKEKIHEQVKKLLEKNNSLSSEFENSLDDLFNPKQDKPESKDLEAKEWLEKRLEPTLSRKMFATILTVYRCRKAELSISKL